MPEQFCLDYHGKTLVDRRFSAPMVRWVIADIKRRKQSQRVTVRVETGNVVGCSTDGGTILTHAVTRVVSFTHEMNNMRTFMYVLRDETDSLEAHVFTAPEYEDVVKVLWQLGMDRRRQCWARAILLIAAREVCQDAVSVLAIERWPQSQWRHTPSSTPSFYQVVEIFQSMKEGLQAPRSHSSAASLTSLCSDISPSNSQFFEVLYVGKIKVPHRQVPHTFIDDALARIHQHELNKQKQKLQIDNEYFKSKSLEMGRKLSDAGEIIPHTGVQPGHQSSNSSEIALPSARNRAGSLGMIETMRMKKPAEESNHNRTMLFYVGRQDIKLISPDRKQVLLHKMLQDITKCSQGITQAMHFGLVSQEADCHVGYVFRCESESVAEDVVAAINQSFNYVRDHKPNKQPVLSCDHCPMLWYHKLCADIENESDKKCQMTILKRIETLPEEEQEIIHAKLLGAESNDIKDQVTFLMVLLRAHCEAKQAKHLHDTVENRSEFLNQYLGGSTIFMKAKRSLTSSFDQLLKRKASNIDKDSIRREVAEPRRRSSTVGTVEIEQMKKELKLHASLALADTDQDKETSVELQGTAQKKPSLSDIAALAVTNQKLEKNLRTSEDDLSEAQWHSDSAKTPMINIFLKVGSTPKADEQTDDKLGNGSWRQAIFNRVVSPSKPSDSTPRRKTSHEYRALWRKAINQQVLLIRMERENARLRARQEEATVKRIKLEYDELGACNREYMGIWDLISKDSRISSSRCDSQMLLQAIRQGVPRGKRGDVWHFLASQFCLKQPPFDTAAFPNYDVPYEELLKRLTSCQHAILIDLGRTFPNHPYFASPLGPGQLALFNLLKAYSLLDPQVGYCQGLSFVAAVLLLHMAEEQAFLLLRHLMFRRGLRRQYLPDMAALQVQLYQLSRLLHDQYPLLYQHLDSHEITPTLYAAPWMLTIFASQFPLGFVTRVFDLLFSENSTDVTFRMILALLSEHQEQLLCQTSFEDIMEYLKSNLTEIDGPILDKVMKKVLNIDIAKQLHEYEVEYHVLQEEMSSARPEKEQLRRLTLENQRLQDQNLALVQQLEVVNQSANRLERARTTQQATISKLETQIRNLEITIATLADFIEDVENQHKDIEVPGDIRRLIANLQLAEQRSSKLMRQISKTGKSGMLKRAQTSMGLYPTQTAQVAQELFTAEDLPSGTKCGDRTLAHALRGVPLRVIVDEQDEKPSNFSKITSGVSSFFNSTHNPPKHIAKPLLEGKTNDSFNAEDDLTLKRNFSSQIGSLNLKDTIVNNKKLQKTQSEQAISYKHPLDNGEEVNVTYNPVTQLKSLKPRHAVASASSNGTKHQDVDLITLTSQLLQVNEDSLFTTQTHKF